MEAHPKRRAEAGRSVRRGFGGTTVIALPQIILIVALGGCVHAPLNQPLARYDPKGGFRYTPRPESEPSGDVAVLLFFSGGGKRAAALAYGVLRELRDTTVPDGAGGTRRLLDDVEIVSSVSGGSFTAAYYALRHDAIFDEFESRFLKKNVNGALIRRAFSPAQWPSLTSPYFGRSDLAAEYYDTKIFQGATFGDLVRSGGRPMLLINATDMANGEQFSFSQIRFDLIASDLSSFPLARAVAASSAAPFILTPVTIKNHAGAAGPVQSVFLPEMDDTRLLTPRERRVRRLMLSYTDSTEYPYIHLVDGGLSDNLGLRSLMDASVLQGGLGELAERIGMKPFDKLVIVIVNAAARRNAGWSQREEVPGIRHSIAQIGDNIGAQVNDHSLELFQIMLDEWKDWARAQQGDAPDYFLVRVDFSEISDPDERDFFWNLPTTFTLPDETIDRLVDAGGAILRRSPELKRFLATLETGTAGNN